MVDEPVGPYKHDNGDIDYRASPPSGGDHNDYWINCGFYSEEIIDEMAVHSLEHGAVWIAYTPDATAEESDELKALAADHPYVLAAPYPGLDSRLVVLAWGHRLLLDRVDDPRLDDFVEAFEGGGDAPEAGGACSGAVGQPE